MCSMATMRQSAGLLRRHRVSDRISFSRERANASNLRVGCRQECPRQESNLDPPLRRRLSYPLDYEGQSPARGARKEGYRGPAAAPSAASR
jgi:hypothetical protein